mmetsp:Transcript_19313/g.48314  ORF Transcript_19313/g.48314 Transcript_19313/m.48314 type:complete len:265 (+) Transcript_19313:1350-2144(+)
MTQNFGDQHVQGSLGFGLPHTSPEPSQHPSHAAECRRRPWERSLDACDTTPVSGDALWPGSTGQHLRPRLHRISHGCVHAQSCDGQVSGGAALYGPPCRLRVLYSGGIGPACDVQPCEAHVPIQIFQGGPLPSGRQRGVRPLARQGCHAINRRGIRVGFHHPLPLCERLTCKVVVVKHRTDNPFGGLCDHALQADVWERGRQSVANLFADSTCNNPLILQHVGHNVFDGLRPIDVKAFNVAQAPTCPIGVCVLVMLPGTHGSLG